VLHKNKNLLSLVLVVLVLAGAGLIFSAWADFASASRIILTGDAEGLRLDPEGPLFTEENMAPGHEATADLTVRNEGENDFDLTVSAKKTGGNDEDGLLFKALQVKITGEEGAPEYYSGSMSELNGAEIGKIPAGESKDLDITVLFPEEKGNEYQGTSVEMSWIFHATGDSEDDGGGGGRRRRTYEYEYEPEPPAAAPEEEQDDELIIEPEAPGAKPEMPKTGVGAPYLYYLLGALALLTGTKLIRKPK